MICYFDTSAVVPLIIEEPSTARCVRMWNDSSRAVSARFLYPEARAALAKARRMGRVTTSQLTASVEELDAIIPEIDHIEIAAGLARRAGELADTHDLRGYDAIHLAAAIDVADDDLVLVTGDADLAAAAISAGIAVAITADPPASLVDP